MNKRVRFDKRIGEKFNRLTLLSVDGFTKLNKNGKRYRIGTLLCECGNKVSSQLADVVSGNTKSCGCSKRKHSDKAVMRMYSGYSSNAKARDYSFKLSHMEFDSLINDICHYCGIKPSHNLSYRGESHLVNGIDRINNDEGYFIGNVVSCCSICNQSKHTLSYNEFLSWIERLKSHEIK